MQEITVPAAAELVSRLDAIDVRARELVDGLDDDALHRRPPAGGWSIAEVLEHLVLMGDGYAAEVRAALGRPQPPAGDPTRWRPSLFGGLLLRAMSSPRRMPAPRGFRPGPAPRPNILGEFLRTTAELRELIARARGLDWNAIRVRSPAMRLLRLRLGEALAASVMHADRHLNQVARIRMATEGGALAEPGAH